MGHKYHPPVWPEKLQSVSESCQASLLWGKAGMEILWMVEGGEELSDPGDRGLS